MAKSIVHRGPDEFGLYRDDAIGLVHTRLSIVDLTSGQQPLANEDETIFVVFNGEIFNFVELREELVEKGHVFRTRSDTEVIVHAFETWGEEAFTRFNGQFAIALWDTVRKRLVLARDRFGVRPLHFAESDGAFYFASEAKAIFAAAPSLSRAFDPIGLDQTLTFWAPIAPRTPFAAISELPPGHVMILDGASTTTRPFVELGFPASPDEYFRGTLDEAREAVHAALEKATRLRIVRADVPVGSYLSGGLDSSLLAALAIGQREGRLSTFSLRFADAEYDETSYQREMVERIGSDHHEIVVERRAIADAFPRAVAHAERMILRTAPVPLMLLSGLVRDHGIKVVLTGEGADEMFGGYDIFREGKVRRFWAKRPDSTLRPLLLDRLYPYLARSPVAQRAMARRFFGKGLDRYAEPGFAHEPRWSGTSALKRFFAPHVSAALTDVRSGEAFVATLPEAFRSWAPLSQDQYIEIRTLLSSYLLSSQGDRMLMAHSVEGRFPFLDVDVAALANRLPPSYKLRVLDEKHVLKRVARGLLPPSILERPKQPYRAPDALAFLADPRPEWVSDLLSTETSRRVGVFEPALVEGMWAKLSSRREDTQVSNTDNMALVGVLSLHLLHREVLTKTYASGDDLSFRTFIDRSTLA